LKINQKSELDANKQKRTNLGRKKAIAKKRERGESQIKGEGGVPGCFKEEEIYLIKAS